MNTYEKEAIGNIILMKNIVFTNTKENTHEIDHSWKTGRPCLIIYSDDEYDYFFTIKSFVTNEKYQQHSIPLNEDELLYKDVNRFNKHNSKRFSKIVVKGFINIETIYKAPIAWHDEIGKITLQKYKEVIDKTKEYYKQENLDSLFQEAQKIGGR